MICTTTSQTSQPPPEIEATRHENSRTNSRPAINKNFAIVASIARDLPVLFSPPIPHSVREHTRPFRSTPLRGPTPQTALHYPLIGRPQSSADASLTTSPRTSLLLLFFSLSLCSLLSGFSFFLTLSCRRHLARREPTVLSLVWGFLEIPNPIVSVRTI